MSKEEFNKIYDEIFKLVQSGFTIDKACKKQNISRTDLYRKMDFNQKYNLKELKILNSTYSCSQTYCRDLVQFCKNIHENEQ